MAKIDFTKAKKTEIETYNSKVSDINEAARTFYEKEREIWIGELEPLYTMLATRDYINLTDLQSKNLSLRHRIQDSITKHLNKLSIENAKYKKAIGDRQEFYIDGFGYKSTSTEKTKMIERDLAERKCALEILECHIEHTKELRSACDQIQYSVKNITALMGYIL